MKKVIFERLQENDIIKTKKIDIKRPFCHNCVYYFKLIVACIEKRSSDKKFSEWQDMASPRLNASEGWGRMEEKNGQENPSVTRSKLLSVCSSFIINYCIQSKKIKIKLNQVTHCILTRRTNFVGTYSKKYWYTVLNVRYNLFYVLFQKKDAKFDAETITWTNYVIGENTII